MPSTIISQFQLPVSIEAFQDIFWKDNNLYEFFLCEYLHDLSVTMSEWQVADPMDIIDDSSPLQRTVRCYHPANVNFPGMPSHAESLKTQVMQFYHFNDSKLVITESNTLRGIPYADYFTVDTVWDILSIPTSLGTSDYSECVVTITLNVIFHKSTWLQGTIEANTKAELIDVINKWEEFARKQLKAMQMNKVQIENEHGIYKKSVTTDTIGSLSPKSDKSMSNHLEEMKLLSDNEEIGMTIDEDASLRNLISYISDPHILTNNRGSGENILSSNPSSRDMSDIYSEEELLFYDCEDGQNIYSSRLFSSSNKNPSTQETLNLIYTSPKKPSRNEQSTHDVAVNIVETLIVLAQFSYWQAHHVYMYDLKELFNINTKDVISRMVIAFLPGYHSQILVKPDLYGPILAVIMLPQAVLLSMDTSKHGCSQSAVLGNSTIVSICLWLCISLFYRLLAFVIAQSISMKHCLCLVGYSFFAWNVALICSYPLEKYQEFIGIPIALPIVLFGIPSAIAQAYVFWEYTPTSTMTLKPNSFPSSLQQFAQNHSRFLQKVLWNIPKILIFVIVMGTHYQFLWYLARVFLPGRRQQCELSALIQPAQYADIITQKELRDYAFKLLRGKKHRNQMILS